MKPIACLSLLSLALVCVLVSPSVTNAQTAAIKVLGQSTFTTATLGTSASKLNYPFAAVYDAAGNLYVSDNGNNRVVIYKSTASKSSGAAADYVLGQTNFVSSTSGTSATTMGSPAGLAIDASGNLYVAEDQNNRVLIFKGISARIAANTLTNGAAADYVIGQPDFASSAAGTISGRLSTPSGLAVSPAGDVYVSEPDNNRISVFNGVQALVNSATYVNGSAANKVFGQASFSTTVASTTNTGLYSPRGLAIGGASDLYVADYFNNRVLVFTNATAKASGAAANIVLGQSSFTASATGTGLGQMNAPHGVTLASATGPLYVTDGSANNRILVYPATTSLTNGAAAASSVGASSGTPTAYSLFNPWLTAFRAGEGLWIADLGNHRMVLYANGVPLPVRLESFTAKPVGAKAIIGWSIAPGQDCSRITMQRSADGNSFANIYDAMPAAGEQSYRDEQPVAGSNYYRLEMEEPGGAISYSNTERVMIRDAGSYFQLSPVPATTLLSINTNDETLQGTIALLTDAQGKGLRRIALKTGSQSLAVDDLQPGMYILRLANGQSYKVIKQ